MTIGKENSELCGTITNFIRTETEAKAKAMVYLLMNRSSTVTGVMEYMAALNDYEQEFKSMEK